LADVKGEIWSVLASHPERGSMSFNDQANMLLGHDLYHVDQVSALLSS
jgi:hypothetical protein